MKEQKDGPGTLMRLSLILKAPPDCSEQHCQLGVSDNSLMVLLAISRKTGRFIMSKWLRKKKICTLEASEWNELTQSLQERRTVESFTTDYTSLNPLRLSRLKTLNGNTAKTPYLVILVDIALLDLSTDIWKEQFNFLDDYKGKATFAWILNHDTPHAIKMEMGRKGHVLMVNKPLYKSKMIHLLEAVVNERSLEMQRKAQDLCECHEADNVHVDAPSSDESDVPETAGIDAMGLRCGNTMAIDAVVTNLKSPTHWSGLFFLNCNLYQPWGQGYFPWGGY